MTDKIYTLPISPEQCRHEVCKVLGQICEIVDDETYAVYAYRLEVSVHCVQCGMPFTFLGLPEGVDITEPMSNLDHTTARLPIKPLILPR